MRSIRAAGRFRGSTRARVSERGEDLCRNPLEILCIFLIEHTRQPLDHAIPRNFHALAHTFAGDCELEDILTTIFGASPPVNPAVLDEGLQDAPGECGSGVCCARQLDLGDMAVRADVPEEFRLGGPDIEHSVGIRRDGTDAAEDRRELLVELVDVALLHPRKGT